ncbi:diguanylate cyclase [Deinococcus aluminii]|uniref:GGDEF domain-containing protein n=1 Tax=Deinococcus aluminii TaxID=1656885 RepID=A0ABP9XGW2_9DEIO
MPAAPLPPDEPARLAALARYGVLDTPPEEAFERLARLAAHVLEVPVAGVALVDGSRQWEKASFGKPRGEVPRAEALDAWTVLGTEVLVVPDARQDPRLAGHPAVRSGQVVLYAAAPLLTPDGHAIGTLSVTDDRVRPFGPGQAETLRLLAAVVMDELELRRRTRELVRARDHARTLRELAELLNEPLGPQELARRALTLLHARMPLDWSGLLHLTPGGPAVLGDHAGERGAAFGLILRERLALEDGPLWAALVGQDRVFLDDYAAAAERCPYLLAAGLRSAAWLHLGGTREGQVVLVLARLGRAAAWTPGERALLEAAARSVGTALERVGYVWSLERAAQTDPLTGLGNRRALDEALDEAERRRAGTGLGYALGVVDLDGMKHVNDERGHASGDDLLREFAGQLAAPDVAAYRLGGDEYALLHLRPASPEAAVRVLVDLVAAAERHVRARGYPAGASLGVATVPGDAPDATTALRTADARMYARKRERRAARMHP